ncbi:hypothetical protein PH213_43700 [Streptomyces sp. SRF1]|uniref:hypothetical protein n=1 Tax=Streptomyces sp. SRF1 TaxID=1549642 RepID=UPI0025AF4685|nr:hypothetical protein [Streptomyces sp. SRF1]MDN3061278.1 hypothetical protein [Streptomyces sp. SRF1]
MFDEKNVLEAVRRRIEERGEASKLGLPDTAKITWHPLLEGETVRSIESRTQRERNRGTASRPQSAGADGHAQCWPHRMIRVTQPGYSGPDQAFCGTYLTDALCPTAGGRIPATRC